MIRPVSTRVRRTLTCSLAALVVLLGTAGPAAAHVHVTSDDAAQGGEAGVLTFQVPTESDTASTTAVSVDLPKDTPFAFVSAEPLPGWTVDVTETPLGKTVTVGDFSLTKAVTKVTWTAQRGSGIAPHQFQQFNLSVGPFPDTSSLQFPTEQTMSDGTVVMWNQPTPAGGKEPENPTPALTLQRAGSETGADPIPATDGVSRVLSGAALVVALIGLGVAVMAARRRTPVAG